MKTIRHFYAFTFVLAAVLSTSARAQDITPLEPGKPITRTAKAREAHTYQLTLTAGQFIRVIVEQNELDVAVELVAPDNKVAHSVSAIRYFGTESLSWGVVASGTHKLIIRVLATSLSPQGDYQVQLEVGDAATPQHKQRIAAERLLSEMGSSSFTTLAVEQRFEKYQQALQIWRELNDRQAEAHTHDVMAATYFGGRNYEQARECLKQSLAIKEEMQDHLGRVVTLSTLGQYARSERNTTEARTNERGQHLMKIDEDYQQQALALSRTIKHRGAERFILSSLGGHYNSQNLPEKKISVLEQLMNIDRETNNRTGLAANLELTGTANGQLGRYENAPRYFDEALAILRELKDRAGEAAVLFRIGFQYYTWSRYEKALEYYDLALPIYQELKNRTGEATAYREIGNIWNMMGQFEKAIEYQEKALAIWQETKNEVQQGGAFSNLGSVYRALNRNEKAIEYLEKALPIGRKMKDFQLERNVLITLGDTYYHLGIYVKSNEYYEQALSLSRERRDLPGEGWALWGFALNFHKQGQLEKAVEYYAQALGIFQKVKRRNDVGEVLTDYAATLRALGQTEKAVSNNLLALQIAREIKARSAEAAALNGLLLDWKARQQSQLAIFFGKQAVNLYQDMRSSFRSLDQQTQQSFLKSKESTYRELADLLIAQGRLPEAEQVIRMLKEEEYFEYVRRDKDNSPKGEKAALTLEEAAIEKRYREIADKLTEIGTQRGELLAKEARSSEDEKLLTKLEADLTIANQAFLKFLDGLAAEMAQRKGGDTQFVKVREAQGLMEDLRDLGKGTVALYTLVGENKFRMILTTPDVQKAYEVSIKGADLNRKVLAFRAVLQNPKLDPRPAAEELYKILFAPLAKDLEQMKAKTLMWSLDGVLRYVPIAALYDGKQYLVERFQHVMFTNESKARLKDAVSKNWHALGLGVTRSFGDKIPALPAVAEEMRSIINDGAGGKGVLPGTIKLDEQFTQEAMFTGLRQRPPVVHVASHFQFQPGSEMDSALLLGDGKFLSLAQINVMATPFSGVELLTLSACNTATSGSNANGKEVEGFGMLAQRKGAKAVVASLWPVADRTTRLLMEEFYRGREARKLTKGEALRQAQGKLLRGELTKQASEAMASREIKHDASATTAPPFTPDAKRPHAHPYYWAPFILIGNWK